MKKSLRILLASVLVSILTISNVVTVFAKESSDIQVVSLDLSDPSSQMQEITLPDGNVITIGASEAIPRDNGDDNTIKPFYIYDLESPGSYTRKIYAFDLWGYMDYYVDYDIARDGKVTIDIIYDNYTWGLAFSDEIFQIDRKAETATRPARVQYKIKVGIGVNIGGVPVGLGSYVFLNSEFYKGKLDVYYGA